jgi:hypothetical protein
MAGDSQLSNQVYTAPQAPDYLGHYAELVKSIPNYGLQFLAAQAATAQNAKLRKEYELMDQKAKAFMELYPAFKNAQIAKLQAEAATYPYRQDLLASQAAYQRAHAAAWQPMTGNTPGAFSDIKPSGGAAKTTGAAPGAPAAGSVPNPLPAEIMGGSEPAAPVEEAPPPLTIATGQE